ncbi:Orct [Bugula neritina]|uniref:Orct n=1 Tax=Bugula neritina TaxID=10212 RepID=A0A7J7KE61_BUGNE|nr:Orct [Bugula neritina]
MTDITDREPLLASEENDKTAADSSDITDLTTSTEVSSSSQVIWQFDDAVSRVGVGRYQYVLWFFLSLVSMSCGFNNMSMVFEGGQGGHVCATPGNTTSADNHTILYFPGKCTYNTSTIFSNGSTHDFTSIECTKWVYNRSVFNSTVNYEWDLTCNKEYLIDLASTIYMLGFFTGCIILGDLADRFGRRLLLLIAALLTLAASLGAAYSPDYEVFVALRFFIGMGVAGTRNSAYILAAEFARPKDRGLLGLLSDNTYSIAYILTGVIFYLDPNWRRFQLYIALSHILYLTYVFFMPESPRWLMMRGKTKQAMNYFRTSARINKKHLPSDVKIVLNIAQHQSHSTLDLFKTPNLRKLGVVCLLLWFMISLEYFGMSYNVGNLQGSIYVNNAILGAVELVANFLAIWVIKIGRRRAILLSFLIATLSMLAICFAQGSYWATIILAMLGKFVVSPGFSFIYISTTELYPTQTRTLALGTGSGLARLAGAVAAFVPSTVPVWEIMPYIIFSAAGAVGFLAALFLPETMNRPLPDSLESAERMNIVTCHSVLPPCRRRKKHRVLEEPNDGEDNS